MQRSPDARRLSLTLVLTILITLSAIYGTRPLARAILFAQSKETELQPIPLYFQRQLVDKEQKAINFYGEVYLSLSFFSRSLHTAVYWDDETGKIRLQTSGLTLLMEEEKTEALFGEEKISLKRPPLKRDSDLWLPLEVALRLGVKRETVSDRLSLLWKSNYLLFVQSANYEGRPGYLFQIGGDFSYKSFLLENPSRLVIDLKGVELYPFFNKHYQPSETVKEIRVGMFDQKTLRVVFDLNRLIGYRIIRSVEEPGLLTLVFNSLLKEVGFISTATEPKIYIDTSHPVQYKTMVALDPHRVIVEVWDVTLDGNPLVIPGQGSWARQVRVSQFDPQTIRVVLDVKEPRSLVVTVSRQEKNRLEIKTIQEITALSWKIDQDGGKLFIRSSGELEEEITRLKDPNRLRITLYHAVLGEDLNPSFSKDSPLQVKEEEGSMVTIEIEPSADTDYDTLFSADRHEMTIRTKRSPLQNVVILLDPGHGGIDSGGIGGQGAREKEINLAVSLRLRRYLEEAGARVVMTRDRDFYLGLYERVALANRAAAALTLSIHSNFHPNPKVNGFEIFYHPDRKESHRLAQVVFDQVTKGTELKPLAVKASKELVMARETQMPSVLVEMGFLSNYQEEALLRTEKFQEEMAKCLFEAIICYMQAKRGASE